MNGIPDHPAIANALRSGWPSGKEPAVPTCPVCHEETYETYSDEDKIVGCPNCVSEDFKEFDVCPVCGARGPEHTYRNRKRAVVGCCECVTVETED